MHGAARALRWFGAALGLLIALFLAVFGLLQTQAGRTWLARTVAQATSDPDFTVAIEGLSGIVPFRLTVGKIEVGDRDGIYLTLRNVGLDFSATALLARRLHIRSLSIGEINMARMSTAPSTTPVTEYFKVPHLPVEVVLDRLSIGRLALAPPVLGESVVATVEANAQLAGETAHVALDLHRTDDAAGNIELALELAGGTPVLSLRLDAAEPTGVLLDRFLGRTDRPPLALSVNGSGPLADWHGRLSAAAGTVARLDADLNLAVTTKTILGLSGTAAALASLLPPEFAPLAGDRLVFSLHAAFGDRIEVDALSIDAAVGTVTGDGAFGGPNGAVEAHLRANVPELAPFAGLVGGRIEGAASLTANITGTEKRPALTLNLSGTAIRLGSSGAEHIEAEVSATPTDVLDKPDARIDFAAKGRIEGLIPPEGVAVPRELGRDIDWSLAGIAARDGSTVDLTRLSAEGAGLTLNGTGQFAGDQTIEGQLNLSIADLRPFSGLAGHPLAGAVELAADAVRQGTTGFKATLHGSTKELRTGIAMGDALLGGAATLTGSFHRDAAGTLTVDQLTITGAAINLSGNGQFDPTSNRLVAASALELPRLKPFGPALGVEMAGAASARINAEGTLDRLRLKSEVEGNDLIAAGAKIDRLRLTGELDDLAKPKGAVDGTYRAYGLDGTLAVTAELDRDSQLVLPRVRLTAADSAIEGSLRVALDTGLMQGSINGRAPDLGRFSRFAGTALGGNLVFSAGLDARRGQLLDLSLNGDRLTAGTGSSRVGVGRVVLTARFADVLRAPSGTGRLALTSASLGKAEFATANLSLDAPRAGRFALQGDAKGQPLTVALAGDGTLEPNRTEVQITRLTGSLGSDRILLRQPVTISKRGPDLSFSGLALDFGTGQITSSGGIRGESLSLALNAANLPVASGAQLLGYRKARGSLTIATTLDGTLRAPRGHVSLNARGLSFAASKNSRLPTLGLDLNGNWNGRNIDIQGQVIGLKGDSISLAGSAPLLLTPSPLGISIPANGALSLKLQGAGRLENLADLLPLGEDRVSGQFAADIAAAGTVAAPSASGRLKLSDGRYENFATGAVLTNLQAEAVGDRNRITLNSFSAGDSSSGSIKAQGNVVLTGPSGPTAALSATLANFRVAASDEAAATATGTVSITGPLTAPKVAAPLTIDRADINLPDSLPPNVVVIKVTRANSNAGKQPPAAPAPEPPALPATLDIRIDMPGNIFVRGHGLDSEWRGKLAITGTSAAPAINGSLEQIRGSVDLLGKTFTLTRGRIIFDGSDKLDPVLDIVAEASTSDISAQVNIGGLASAPTITLTSTPVVPQDEILSRVLFGKSVGQITPGEGIQLAAAAATLAGGGPGVLDRLRGGLGLDWFRLGSSTSGPTTGSLNSGGASNSTSNSAASGTALSAGKYIVPGVSVGVSQGISPPTSKITVEVQVRPHLTVGGEVGQGGGTGLGINYNYDY
jgi:translocation and assembly module TamB